MSSAWLVFFLSLLEHRLAEAYVPQQPLVEPLSPIGIRISIPHDEGITLVAFHVKFNEEFDGLEAGTIARDILRRTDGRWTYEDRSTVLKRDDVVHYWIHVVYNGLGYNLINQQHIVAEFYNYKGQRIGNVDANDQVNARPPGCNYSATKLYDSHGNSRYACEGQLLFQEDFRDITQFQRMQWSVLEQFSGGPDYEFVVYKNSSENLNVSNGLKITPRLRAENNEYCAATGKLTLNQCTGRIGTADCSREAQGWSILPPVTSSRINTKNSFTFVHGRVEMRARLPQGDWIYPLLMLEPTSARDLPQIRVASANGNPELRTATGKDISGHVLWGGVTCGPSQWGARFNGSTVAKFNNDLWTDRFHTYEMTWSPDRVVLRVDGEIYDNRNHDLPSDTPFYLTIGVAVGGLSEFPDNCASHGYTKTWRNIEAKALYRFCKSTELWYKTWHTDKISLNIDYLKIWAL
ncbi:beta-1,3-glucan-binding protein 1-like [Phymastichus coffea]|uniref:beta-1,3-glucan-binding protein 1-like n=1 Tax=Phymastichus coffea TaxID=108790 RepID=UPI00273C0F13|nr:beta-1,3-glucan-binding protein 1-like [Phymastichus coffea]